MNIVMGLSLISGYDRRQVMCVRTNYDSLLSSQERSLLYLTARGETSVSVAETLGIAAAEVQARLDALQERFGLPSRSALIVHAIVQGWV